MTEWLIGLVPQYGVHLLAFSTFISCLGVPIPASVLMLTAGGFVASGDLTLAESAGYALAGAIAGDQTGFGIGRWRGEPFLRHLSTRSNPVDKARAMLVEKGALAVFLSRWFASALGPYVNFAAGAAGQSWLSFTLWGIAGEMVWVSLYVGLGYVFTGNLELASDMATNLLGFVAAALVALGLGYWLLVAMRSDDTHEK
ncbi:DedA family protein [Ciceribacter sp. L1K22]|uniref:DedA family protein n=1 Tax=Ciceribacter sp. L1K22 TaxID=2820275 RepID=UPI001ABE1687|nr:DedA family protein [Ciceribacter sp. L1K22]MBO3760409.1 DedA family protein [Ciceribacter sp. L1K22]